jgi:hypothetical protein
MGDEVGTMQFRVQGEQIKNFDEKEKEKNMSCVKIKECEHPGSLKCIRNFKASRLKDPLIFQPCAIR